MKKKPKPRNPIARVVRKIRPKVVPDKRRKLRERAKKNCEVRISDEPAPTE
jgi:hypothetical protein